jgi:hypothetical protein
LRTAEIPTRRAVSSTKAPRQTNCVRSSFDTIWPGLEASAIRMSSARLPSLTCSPRRQRARATGASSNSPNLSRSPTALSNSSDIPASANAAMREVYSFHHFEQILIAWANTSRQPSICSPRSWPASPGGRSRAGPSWPPRIAPSIPTWSASPQSAWAPRPSSAVLDVIRKAAAAVAAKQEKAA